MWDRFIGAHFLENVTKGPRNGNPGGHGQWQTERWYPSGAPQNNQRERRRRRKKDIYTQRYRKERCGFAQGCGIVFRRSFFSRKRRGCYNVDDSIFGRLFRPGLSGNILFGIDRKKKNPLPIWGKTKSSELKKRSYHPCVPNSTVFFTIDRSKGIYVCQTGNSRTEKQRTPKMTREEAPKRKTKGPQEATEGTPNNFFMSKGGPKGPRRR